MSCDALWVHGRKEGEYCLKTRGNKKNVFQKNMGKLC
jgi:hypothetical protein